jgi:murein DD-endopeptidase MepM/ murein hydrolase activator NlpD
VPSRFVGEALALASDTSPPQQAQQMPDRQQIYEVQKGDTLYRLARRFGTTVERLMALNAIDKPESMQAGARLVIPATGGSLEKSLTPAGEPQPGKTGESLARKPSVSRYRLQWPVQGIITSRFGRRNGRQHDGIDIGAPKGAQVHAAADGEVLFAAKKGGYGNLILIRHAGGLITVYAHNHKNLVRRGQRVRAGQVIGTVGQTGRATGPHLHFEVRRGVKPDNPLQHLPP